MRAAGSILHVAEVLVIGSHAARRKTAGIHARPQGLGPREPDSDSLSICASHNDHIDDVTKRPEVITIAGIEGKIGRKRSRGNE